MEILDDDFLCCEFVLEKYFEGGVGILLLRYFWSIFTRGVLTCFVTIVLFFGFFESIALFSILIKKTFNIQIYHYHSVPPSQLAGNLKTYSPTFDQGHDLPNW